MLPDMLTDLQKRSLAQALRELELEGVIAGPCRRLGQPPRGPATIIPFPAHRVSQRRLGEPPEAA
jgi:hypothetical protein